ncbi:MAG: DUF2202 domain-containing protein [Anaerolineae bacterium]|jgi:hypothetical protein|nr:DUF2202 domain-containing protein [Anaerolineae bacterium]
MVGKMVRLTVLGFIAFLLILTAAGNSMVRAASLDAFEAESLLYVREEEKLARDTYLTLYGIWGTDIFQTIANSEQAHMDAVKALLDKYGLEDPALPEIGVFQNDFLQEKYDELVAWGAQSEADALLVGCLIEEIDLIDLIERMAQITKRDILTVFQNLVDGSENHLRAFVARYESLTGNTYTPVYLDRNTYLQIITGDSDSGGGGNETGGGGNGRGNGGPQGGR